MVPGNEDKLLKDHQDELSELHGDQSTERGTTRLDQQETVRPATCLYFCLKKHPSDASATHLDPSAGYFDAGVLMMTRNQILMNFEIGRIQEQRNSERERSAFDPECCLVSHEILPPGWN